MYDMWCWTAKVSCTSAAAVKGYANSVIWSVEAKDLNKAELMLTWVIWKAKEVNDMLERNGFDVSDAIPQVVKEENARVFGENWDWHKVKDEVGRDVKRAEDAVANLKILLAQEGQRDYRQAVDSSRKRQFEICILRQNGFPLSWQ
jgi:hypothetical protein